MFSYSKLSVQVFWARLPVRDVAVGPLLSQGVDGVAFGSGSWAGERLRGSAAAGCLKNIGSG